MFGNAGKDAAPRSTPGDESRSFTKAEILVCDDSITDRTLLKTLLRRRFQSIDLAENGEQALHALDTKTYDVLLIDLEMPLISGVEVVRRAREMPRYKDHYLPIILLTARTTQQDKLLGLNAGATDFLTKPFDPAELLARISNHIQARQLQDRLRETNRALEEERGKVISVQMDLLPEKMPSLPGICFGAHYQPSGMASGDYYDVIKRPGGKLLLAVGDVSGHGIPSAMHMSVLRACLHSEADQKGDIEQIIRRLNHLLCHALGDFSFVTFCLAEYDPKTGVMHHLSAGHPAPLIYDPVMRTVRELEQVNTLPLGIEDDILCHISETILFTGQRLVFYTDGITEQPSPGGTQFDVDGLKSAIKDTMICRPEAACREIVETVRRHAEGAPLQDDLTLLMMHIDAGPGT